MEFPIYVKHPDHSVWYEIKSSNHFSEFKRMGESKYPSKDHFIHTEIADGDYGTVLYIQDILDRVAEGGMTKVSHAEFLSRDYLE